MDLNSVVRSCSEPTSASSTASVLIALGPINQTKREIDLIVPYVEETRRFPIRLSFLL